MRLYNKYTRAHMNTSLLDPDLTLASRYVLCNECMFTVIDGTKKEKSKKKERSKRVE